MRRRARSPASARASTARSGSSREVGSRSSAASAASSRWSAAHERWPSASEAVGDDHVQLAPLTLRQARVRHVAQRRWRKRHRGAPSSVRTISSASSSSCEPSLDGVRSLAGRASPQLVEVERDEEDRRRAGRGRACGAGSASIRAATTACTVGGTRARPGAGPSRSSMPVVSTMKNGLPPARSAIDVGLALLDAVAAGLPDELDRLVGGEGSAARARVWSPRRLPSAAAALDELGSREREHERGPPSAARGEPLDQIEHRRRERRARPRTPARPARRRSGRRSSRRNPLCTSCTNADSSRPGSASPRLSPSPAATRSISVAAQHPSTSSRRRSVARSGESSSSMPASWRTIAATGAKLALPAGDLRVAVQHRRRRGRGRRPARRRAATCPIPDSPDDRHERRACPSATTRRNARRSVDELARRDRRTGSCAGPIGS